MREVLHKEMRAIIQRGLIEHEQILYRSSNRRMEQLVDWLPNQHRTPDTGLLTYLLFSKGAQARGDQSCPVKHRVGNSPLIN